MTNQEIAKILYELAAFYEMQNVPFKPRAYEKAALAVESFDHEAEEVYKEKGFEGFLEIAGIGHGIAGHVEELVKTGQLKIYEQLRRKIPVNLSELLQIESLGPKRI
ncbi:MAG: DNA polymerase III, partial [bacterium]|nr:DNA polymerase III [bacterium]